MTPKVVVKEQEYVMAGGPLFIDKNHPEVKFVSPVSGVVTSVERGARRKVLNIVVEAATEQDYEEFGKMDPSKMSAQEVKDALLQAGMFAFDPPTSVRRNRRPDGDAESNLYLRFRQQPAGSRLRVRPEGRGSKLPDRT